MSTLSGIQSKGEKGKAKYQSLDINNLYRASRGESLETHQHKNLSSRRHGMQSLGKVPSARRPPVNLPSIKSEYSGNDPAVNLVPSGGSGWGSKPGETGPPPTQASQPPTQPAQPPTQIAPAAAAAAPVTAAPPPPASAAASAAPAQGVGHADKSWSSVTSASTENNAMFLAHQSPYFQQQFPSLSGDGGAASVGAGTKGDAHFPGPSLRPQKEGSWMQGGSRPPGQMGAAAGNQQGTAPAQGPLPHTPQGIDGVGGRSNLGPSGVAGGPAGPLLPPPSHHRLMPNFMIRHGHPSAGMPPNYQQHGARQRFPYPPDHRPGPPNRPSNIDPQEITARPIIKEEDLKNMDEIARDTGWATHDEIDYNQTLSFSDEEGAKEEDVKQKDLRQSTQINNKKDSSNKLSEKMSEEESNEAERKHRESSSEPPAQPQPENREPPRAWQQARPVDFRHHGPPAMSGPAHPQPQPQHNRPVNNNQVGRQEDDEIWRERRRLQSKELENVVAKARQRKEEEEKRYEETRQAAARKLKMLEEKLASKSGSDTNKEENNAPSTQQGLNSLLPEWGKDKETARSRTNSGEDKEERFPKENQENLRNPQVDARGFSREKEQRGPERDGSRGAGYYQNNLPPRFQKQALVDSRPPYYNQGQASDGQHNFDSRWSTGGLAGSNFGGSNNSKSQTRIEKEVSNRDKDELRESRDHEKNVDDGSNIREQDRLENSKQSEEIDNYRFCDDVRLAEKKSIEAPQTQSHQGDLEDRGNVRINKDMERRESGQKIELRERPERPQSRDSRTSRESRNSRESIRDERFNEDNSVSEHIHSWNDSSYHVDQRDRRKKDNRQDSHLMHFQQRHIPPPITREKLEASEQKNESNRSMNLVPLIRSDKKLELKKNDNQWDMGGSGGDPWGRAALQTAPPSLNLAVPPTSSQNWNDLSASPTTTNVGQGEPPESQHTTHVTEDSAINVNKEHKHEGIESELVNRMEMQRGKMGSRGANRGMNRGHDRPRAAFPAHNYRGIHSYRGGPGPRRPPYHAKMHEHSSAEGSADEKSVSTESGKEERRHEQDHRPFPRSPKQGSRRSGEERPRDGNRRYDGNKDAFAPTKFDRKGMNMGSFEPRGEPSRRGRGGAPFRSKGSGTTSRRMDGYGPPSSKRPFTSDKTDNGSGGKEKTPGELSLDEKMKLNQQQLSAGLIGHSRLNNSNSDSTTAPNARLRGPTDGEKKERKFREGHGRNLQDGKSGSCSGGEVGDENWETTSETSDPENRNHEDVAKRNVTHNVGSNQSSRPNSRRHSQSNRHMGRDKRRGGSFDRDRENRRPGGGPPGSGQAMVNGGVPSRLPNRARAASKEQLDLVGDKKQPRQDKDKRNNLDRIDLCNTASVVVIDDRPEGTAEEDQRVLSADGFKEVRNKKNVKEANRQKEEANQKGAQHKEQRGGGKAGKTPGSQSPGPTSSGNKGSYERDRDRDRSRPGKLPPRLAKLRETNRMQLKMAQQSHDGSEVNKINQGGAPLYQGKDATCPAPPPAVNAWDKPITASLRTSTPPAPLPAALVPAPTPHPAPTESSNIEIKDLARSATSSQRSSPNEEKATGSTKETEKALLDGSSPPVQTIIFENTNYKAGPLEVAVKAKYTAQAPKAQRPVEKPKDRKMEEDNVSLGFKSPGPEMKLAECKTEQIQMQIPYNKNEDNVDMKLDFNSFNTSIAHLTDDKTNKGISAIHMTRSIQMVSQQSSAADLQFKLASVKKVWDNSSAVLEHVEDSGASSAATSFTPTFNNSLEDSAAYGKPDSTGVDDAIVTSEAVYNSSQQLQSSASNYNGSSVQALIKPDSSSNVCKVKPQPQSAMHGPLSPSSASSLSAQYSQHIAYQPPAQFSGVSAIPSPPTVFNPQPELYPTFQINNSQVPQVLGSQGRSQFSQFASPYLTQSLGQTSAFSQQSLQYLQQPPPSAAPPVPDMFQTQLSQYRIQPPTAYGTSQQLSNNPNTVLISSSANSLMSASVKPSPQPIGAIGSKGASYQTTSQPPPSQLYIYPDPQLQLQTQYLSNSQLVQRQASNVVPTLPPSSASYYSASSGGGGPAGFYQHGSSSVSLQAQGLHQNAFGMQAFNAQSPAGHTPAGMGSFGSTFLSNGLQMAQQYRSSAPQYLKSTADHQVPDVLSVFSSPASQVDSAKPRGGAGGGGSGGKPCGPNGPLQQQPGSAQGVKFTSYHQNVTAATQLMMQQQQQQQRGGVSVRMAAQHYPAPIQRPAATFQPPRHPRLPVRYKMPPPAATAPAMYYNAESVPAKLDNAETQPKADSVNSECDNSASTSSSISTEVSVANSSPSNE